MNARVYNHNKTIIYDCDTVSAVDNGSRTKSFHCDLFTELCGNIFIVVIKNENNFTEILFGVSSNVLPQRDYPGDFVGNFCAAIVYIYYIYIKETR